MWEVIHDGVIVDSYADYWEALEVSDDWWLVECPAVYEGVYKECPHDLDLKERL